MVVSAGSVPSFFIGGLRRFFRRLSWVEKVAWSVGISRISWVKKVSKSNRACIDRIPRNWYMLSVRRTWPLKLLKLEKRLAFSSRLTITIAYFLAKVTMEELLDGGQPPPAKRTCRSPTQTAGRREEARLRKARTLLEVLEKQKGRLHASRKGSNQEHLSYQSKTAFF